MESLCVHLTVSRVTISLMYGHVRATRNILQELTYTCSDRGASPLGRYHHSFLIFPEARTRAIINNYGREFFLDMNYEFSRC